MNSRFMKSDMQKLVSYVIYVNLKISEYKIKHEKQMIPLQAILVFAATFMQIAVILFN